MLNRNLQQPDRSGPEKAKGICQQVINEASLDECHLLLDALSTREHAIKKKLQKELLNIELFKRELYSQIEKLEGGGHE